MKIEHVALWVKELEVQRAFYTSYFGGVCGEKYVNAQKGFSSYFISFNDGARLEIMNSETITEPVLQALGFAHIAFVLHDRAAVDTLTQRLRQDGFAVVSGPRMTGDGYYESCVQDPEGNRVELTAPKE